MQNEKTLFERLGGYDKIVAISEDAWLNHMANPVVNNRYAKSDAEQVKKMVVEFVCWGTGGPYEYTGKSMLEAHTTMNINGDEFVSVVDDITRALDKHGVGQREKEELLFMLFSLRGDVIHV